MITLTKTGCMAKKDYKRLAKKVNIIASEMYFDYVPILRLESVFKNEGLELTDEDGNKNEFIILCGKEGIALFHLLEPNSGKIVKNVSLFVTWFKMPSGRYEVVTYI
jgi:hypothetical protein